MPGFIEPVTIGGRYFWLDGKRFLVKGVAYQDHRRTASLRSDPLADDGIEYLQRDLKAFKELGLNTLLVYHVDHTKNHDAVMELLQDAGIYVLVCLSTPKASINRMAPLESYDHALLQQCFATVDCMAAYPNTLGVLAATEVINSDDTTFAAPIIRAVIRDTKIYMRTAWEISEQRVLPVGYCAASVAALTRSTFDYLTAGSRDESIDFYCLNNFAWVGKNSSMKISGYDKLVQNFSDAHIPIFFSEYGHNAVWPRVFHETAAIYSPKMTHVFSGGCVYEFYQGPNNYGIVEIMEPSHKTKTLRKGSEYRILKKRLLECTEPPVTHSASASDQNDVEPRPFPTQSAFWRASDRLPPCPVDWVAVRSQLELSSWVVLGDDLQN